MSACGQLMPRVLPVLGALPGPCLCRAPCRDALRSIRLTDTEPQLSLPRPRGIRGVL